MVDVDAERVLALPVAREQVAARPGRRGRRGRGRRRCGRSAPRGRPVRATGRGRPIRRPAGPGRTDRRSATGAARRRSIRTDRRGSSSSSAFHAANGAAVTRSTSSSVSKSRVSSSSLVARARARSGHAHRAAGRPGCGAGPAPDPLGDLGADLLRRLPRGSALGAVVARAEDPGDRVVVDRLAVDLAAERVERAVDLRLELDHLGPQVRGHLMGQRRGRGAPRAGGGSATVGRTRRPGRRGRRGTRSTSPSASRSAMSVATRRRSCSSETAVLASHQASFAAISSGRRRAVSASTRASTSAIKRRDRYRNQMRW